MANITESIVFRPGIYQYEISDYLYGGAPALVGDDPVPGATPGLANAQGKQLADRTAYLKRVQDYIKGAASGLKNVVISAKQTATGAPDFLTLTPGSPNNTLAFDTDEPICISFCDGFDEFGPRNYYAALTSLASLSLAANGAYVIYAELNTTTGAVTVGSGSDGDYWIGYHAPASPTNGDYWFDLSTNKMKLRAGGAWTAVVRTIIATASTNTGTEFVSEVEYKTNFDLIYGNNSTPASMVGLFLGTTARKGWLLCSGAAVSRTQYKNLFDAIGTAFGTGDGSTTFNIPDFTSSTDVPDILYRWFIKY